MKATIRRATLDYLNHLPVWQWDVYDDEGLWLAGDWTVKKRHAKRLIREAGFNGTVNKL